MVATPKIFKTGIDLEGNILRRPKMDTATLLNSGEVGFTGSYLKFYAGGVERAIGSNAANALRLDELATPTTAVNLGSVGAYTTKTSFSANDIVNRAYVDGLLQGLDLKASVKVASTEILDSNTDISGSPTYNSTGGTSTTGRITATLAVADTFNMDGIAVANNDRILIKNEGDASGLGLDANGIYFATISGTSLILDRTTDFDSDAKVTSGAYAFVEQGTINADKGFVLITEDPITVGTATGSDLTFSQFSSAGVIQAGVGLTKTGDTIAIDYNDSELASPLTSGLATGDLILLYDQSASAHKAMSFGNLLNDIKGTGIAYNSTDVSLELDINGITNSATSLGNNDLFAIYDATSDNRIEKITFGNLKNALHSTFARKEEFNITGNSTDTDFVFSYTNINDTTAIVQVISTSGATSGEDVICDIERSATGVTVKFGSAPTGSETFTVAVTGKGA